MCADPDAECNRADALVTFCTPKSTRSACLYLWESLEMDNAGLAFRAKVSPEEVGKG